MARSIGVYLNGTKKIMYLGCTFCVRTCNFSCYIVIKNRLLLWHYIFITIINCIRKILEKIKKELTVTINDFEQKWVKSAFFKVIHHTVNEVVLTGDLLIRHKNHFSEKWSKSIFPRKAKWITLISFLGREVCV